MPVDTKVGIAEWRAGRSPGQIATLGLGSCVGIALYDPGVKVGGLAHIMLPQSASFPDGQNPGKFPDTAVPMLLEAMVKLGARRHAVVAKVAGGAQMFSFPGKKDGLLNIGQRNVEATRVVLDELRIRVVAEHTGGNFGRTMILNLDDGSVSIRILGQSLITL